MTAFNKVNKNDLLRQTKTLSEATFPKLVIIEPVNWCNLNCIMCPSSDLTRKRGIMELSLFKKVVDEIALEKPETQLWPAIMGEPLLAAERLFEMLAYAQEKKINVHLNTNAVLLTDYSISRIREYGVKEVIVGIDALSEETYNKIRRGGDFERLCINIHKMLSAYKTGDPKVILQYIITPENEHEAEEFKKRWLAKGAVIKIRIMQGWGNLVGSDYLNIKQKERCIPCPWLNRTMEILWDGEVCQCDGDMDNRYSCGNIYHQTIKEIWNGELKQRREKHYAGNFDYEPCNSCNDWQVGLSKFYFPDDPDRARTVGEII